jgi:hypothetical protein
VATVGKVTLRLNVVVLETPPPDAVTVMVELPAGVEPLVTIVSVEEQVGLQLLEENEAVADCGRPETEKVTGSRFPDKRVAITVVVTDAPCETDNPPKLEREKFIASPKDQRCKIAGPFNGEVKRRLLPPWTVPPWVAWPVKG